MGVAFYLFVFSVFVMLPLLSFLKRNAIFRGGANTVSYTRDAKARRQELRNKMTRVVFVLCLALPVTYIITVRCHRKDTRRNQLVESRRANDRTVETPEGNAENVVAAVVAVLSRNPRTSAFLMFSVVVYYVYINFFYLDGRESNPFCKRHNTSLANRLFNDFKFNIYRPYVNCKCWLLKWYFSVELVAGFGPLPLFVYPPQTDTSGVAEPNKHDISKEEDNEDTWDPEELALLQQQCARGSPMKSAYPTTTASSAEKKSRAGPVNSQGGAHVTRQQSSSRLRAADEAPNPPVAAHEGKVERAQYFFAAHPHGILPMCSMVSLLSNVMNRDKILFVDNRGAPPAAAVVTGATTRSQSNSVNGAAVSASDAVANNSHGPALQNHANHGTARDTKAEAHAPHAASSAPSSQPYAKAVHYIYHPHLERFVMIPDRDLACPRDAVGHTDDALAPHNKSLTVRLRAVVSALPFYIPIMREVYMFHGVFDASYEACRRVLRYNNTLVKQWWRGQSTGAPHVVASAKQEGCTSSPSEELVLPNDLNHLLLYPGGASEALLSSHRGPTRLLLRCRLGFLRLALETRSGLVPCFTFGETDYYRQYGTASASYAAMTDDDVSLFVPNQASEGSASPKSRSASSAEGKGVPDPERRMSPREQIAEQIATKEAIGTVQGDTSPRLPRWVQLIQYFFHQTFGISLPILKNIIPKRGVKGVTVVGRPIYLELPPDLARMYDDSEHYYDKEKERPILRAAQEVYIKELQNLFYTYAPIYLKDPQRHKLIII